MNSLLVSTKLKLGIFKLKSFCIDYELNILGFTACFSCISAAVERTIIRWIAISSFRTTDNSPLITLELEKCRNQTRCRNGRISARYKIHPVPCRRNLNTDLFDTGLRIRLTKNLENQVGRFVNLGSVVQSTISVNPGLNFNLLFWFMHFYSTVHFKTLKNKSSDDQ